MHYTFIHISFINHLYRLICFYLDYLYGRPHTNGALNLKPVFIVKNVLWETSPLYWSSLSLREPTLPGVSKQLETIKHVSWRLRWRRSLLCCSSGHKTVCACTSKRHWYHSWLITATSTVASLSAGAVSFAF